MLPSAWLRWLCLAAQVGALVVGIVDIAVGAIVAAGSLLLLVLWSAIAATNVRRARPRTIYSHPPSAPTVALSWFAPFVVAVAAAAVTSWIEGNGDTTGPAGEDRIAQIRIVTALVAALPLLIALYLPFGLLGKATAWVGGNRGCWRDVLVLPLLTALVTAPVNGLLFFVIRSDGTDATIEDSRTGAVVLFLGLVVLPLAVAWRLGWRAMSETERAARLTWERRNFPEGELDLSDELVARSIVATYLASHPDG